MISAERLIIALAGGIVAGLICAFFSIKNVKPEQKTMVFWSVLLNRIFIGFVIGISAWQINWVLHGILLGVIGSLPMSVPLIFTPKAGAKIMLLYTMGGAVWGFLIELFTTVVFNAPIAS